MKKFLALTAALLMVFAMGACGNTNEPATTPAEGGDEVYTLVYGHMSNPNDVPGVMATDLAELVKEKSNGRLIIDVYPSSQIGSQAELPEMVQTGTIAMTHTTQSVLGQWVPDFAALDTPYLYDDVDQLMKVNATDSPLVTRLNQELIDASGVRLLYNYYAGARQLTLDRAAYTPADLAGLKVRAIGQPMYVAAVTGMGAVPTPLDWSEVVTSLSTGLINGQENPVDVIYANALYEYQSHLIMTSHFLFTGAVVINEEAFKALPEDLQQILLECCKEVQVSTTQKCLEKQDEYLGLLKDKMTIITEEDGLDLDAFKAGVAKAVNEAFGDQYADIYKEIADLKAAK